MNISIKNLMLIAMLAILTGCASVPMAPKEQDAASKAFSAPSSNMAGVYIYRNSFLGKALTKALYVDGVK
jgi:starvation-inducible outer membrane lipoprotein